MVHAGLTISCFKIKKSKKFKKSLSFSYKFSVINQTFKKLLNGSFITELKVIADEWTTCRWILIIKQYPCRLAGHQWTNQFWVINTFNLMDFFFVRCAVTSIISSEFFGCYNGFYFFILIKRKNFAMSSTM